MYYIGLVKPFIAGAVFDQEADECTEGAKVTATNVATSAAITTETDSYGDFWLNDLVPGDYTLVVERAGYMPQKMGPIDARKDINVGDIAVLKV